MMKFEDCLAFTLRWEGGFVNHPDDPGGATNKGITQRTYDSWRVIKRLPVRNVEKITDTEVHDIYLENYWKTSKASSTFDGMDLCVFDSAVNMGVNRAIKFLQETVGATSDGIFGTQTSRYVKAVTDTDMSIRYFCQIRESYYKGLALDRDQFKSFIKGWLNRNESLKETALRK